MSTIPPQFFANRVTGGLAVVATVIRIIVGLGFIAAGAMKFVDLDLATQGMAAAGYPNTPVIPILLGLSELGSGLLLTVGLATRLAAGWLVIVMIGATIANFMTMPPAAPITIVLLILNAFLLWAGPGKAALDNKLAARQAV